MGDHVWDRFLTEQDKAHLAASRPKGRYGFGERPAVLSIDNYRHVVGDVEEPLVDAVKTWPSSTGPAGWKALGHIEQLFAGARAAGIPLFHVTGLPEEQSGVAPWSRTRGGGRAVLPSTPDEQARHDRRFEIVERAAPMPGDVVLEKTAPSAFFGTPLAAALVAKGIDTLIVCGESTSGCVRASVVDGVSYRFRMIVVEECVYDRHEASHAVNLFDMDQKYADVMALADVTAWMSTFGDTVLDLDQPTPAAV